MDSVLRDLHNVDVFSPNLEQHIKNIILVFYRLRESRLKVQVDKSDFLGKYVEFLGHVITPIGIKSNPRKD